MNVNDSGGDGSSQPVPAGSSLEISPGSRTRPIPPRFEYIQVNGCKTPGCENFGVPPREGEIRKGRYSGQDGDGYKVINVGSTDLVCHHCGKSTRLKNNKSIFEEKHRQGSYLWIPTPLRCPDETCPNHIPQRGSKVRQYRRKGKNQSGSDRWQCCLCNKVWVIPKPTVGQYKPSLNLMCFNLLVNKVPISRMMEILGVEARTVYRKIDFIHRQCRLFAASRETRLPGMRFERLYLSTDRQDYMVNWGDRKARKTVQLTAVATADRSSGYLFGLTPNFDPSITPEELEAQIEQRGDRHKAYALREHARLWTDSDYRESVARSRKRYKTSRADMDGEEVMEADQQLPTTGVQVHADYLMHGHYWLLRHFFPNVGKIRFFIDGDAGLLSACMGAFKDRIADRTADIVVVEIDKDLTVDKRQSLHQQAKNWFEAQKALNPGLTPAEVRTKLMAERVAKARLESDDPDHALQRAWISHPFPDLAEPVKRLRYATDYGDYDDEHTGNLLNLGTLWPVDTVFNRIRRRIAYCERPIRSNRRATGLWQIYAPYDPSMIEKMLFIFRVWHNFVWVSPKTGKTAAMGLGLAAGKIRTQDILYYDVRSVL